MISNFKYGSETLLQKLSWKIKISFLVEDLREPYPPPVV